MKSPVRAAAWLMALAMLVYGVYSAVLWANRAPPGAADNSGLVSTANAAEPKPPAAAAPPTPPGPAYQTRKTDPGEEFYRSGNYDKAIAYWTGMAKQGDVEANYRLGREYTFSPSGSVQRDLNKAREYFMVAAKLGDPRSMFEIGTFYDYGMGVPKDLDLAAKWYKYAADYGHAQGQYNFATMLETGEGVAKDEVMAYVYFRLAAAQGFYGVPFNQKTQRADSTAPVPLQVLEARMSKEQIKDGEAKLAAFKVRTGPLEP